MITLPHLSFSPFPVVAEAVQEELESYRACEDDVKRLKTAMVRNTLSFSINMLYQAQDNK